MPSFASAPGAGEGVLRAIERVAELLQRLTRLRAVVASRVDEVVGERRTIFATTNVVAGENGIILAAALPAQKLGGTDRVERVRTHCRVEQLEHRVPRAAAELVLLGLTNELVDAHLVRGGASAGELHLRAHRDVQVLNGEKASSIGRELALAIPLEERELEGKD